MTEMVTIFLSITIVYKMKKILAIEPYYKGSHQHWLDGLMAHSSHEIKKLTLPGVHWKWRMHGGALELAKMIEEFGDDTPDLILFTDMMDVSLFLSLTRKKWGTLKTALYFHENQFAYPVSKLDQDQVKNRDPHYGFINMTSALSVDHVFFNSQYNRETFLKGCDDLLRAMPDCNSPHWVQELENKSSVLRLGLELNFFEGEKKHPEIKTILWNHRWEYDKNPEDFFQALKAVKEKGIPFQLSLIGKRNSKSPEVFMRALEDFKEKIILNKELESREEYWEVLKGSDILPVTSNQEYFGISTAEAICAGVVPLLPHRLAYPELIPEKHHSQFLYRDQNDLHDKLEKFLSQDLPETSTVRDHCRQYDWQRMIQVYDEILELI